MRCDAKEPPLIIGDVFGDLPKNNFTVQVPAESVEKYRNAEGWKEFKRIAAYSNFVCRPQSANLLNKGHEYNIVLNADGNWKVKSIPGWCSISANSGFKKTELTVTIDELPDGQGNREDSIVFSLDGTEYTTCYYIKQYDSERKEDASYTLQAAKQGKGVNIVLLGDGYDAEDKVKGTHPMGGALSLLWHAQAGPIFAATMNQYKLIEAPNMQDNVRKYLMGGTPRVELTQDGVAYSNLDDLNTDITCFIENGFCRFNVNSHLVDINQQSPKQGEVLVEVNYAFSEQGVSISVERCNDSAYLVLPVIASPKEEVRISTREASIKKNKGILYITCEAGYIDVAPTDSDGRIFNPVPGFSFVPLRIIPESIGKKIQINIYFC